MTPEALRLGFLRVTPEALRLGFGLFSWTVPFERLLNEAPASEAALRDANANECGMGEHVPSAPLGKTALTSTRAAEWLAFEMH